MQAEQEREFITCIPSARRIWAVGAVYGDAARLKVLHQSIKSLYKKGDIIIYLGNLMGYGDDVGGVLDEVFSFQNIMTDKMGANFEDIVFLRGQQEEMWKKLLTMQFAQKPESVYPWMINHGVGSSISAYGIDPKEGFLIMDKGSVVISKWTGQLRTLQNDSLGHKEILNSLKHAAVTANGKMLFTSWSINPSVPLNAQKDAFWWGSSVPVTPDRQYDKFSLVIRGESNPVRYGVHNYPYYLHINSGGGKGGPLYAVLIEGELPTKILEV